MGRVYTPPIDYQWKQLDISGAVNADTVDGKHDSDIFLKSLLVAIGDMLYASAADTPAILSAGSNGQVLKYGATIPEWWTIADLAASVITSGDLASARMSANALVKALLTAQGQIVYASAASTPAVLAPGTSGQFLKTQGASANPIWASTLIAVASATLTANSSEQTVKILDIPAKSVAIDAYINITTVFPTYGVESGDGTDADGLIMNQTAVGWYGDDHAELGGYLRDGSTGHRYHKFYATETAINITNFTGDSSGEATAYVIYINFA